MATETSPYQEPFTPATRTAGWTGSDLALGSALIVLLIALFLPWFSSAAVPDNGTTGGTGSSNGPQAHGYLWAVFAAALVALVVLVARDAIGRLPGNLPSPEQVFVGATGLALVLTLLGVAAKPSPVALAGWSYGGFVAVLAAAVAFVAAFGSARPLNSVRRAAQSAFRRPGTNS